MNSLLKLAINNDCRLCLFAFFSPTCHFLPRSKVPWLCHIVQNHSVFFFPTLARLPRLPVNSPEMKNNPFFTPFAFYTVDFVYLKTQLWKSAVLISYRDLHSFVLHLTVRYRNHFFLCICLSATPRHMMISCCEATDPSPRCWCCAAHWTGAPVASSLAGSWSELPESPASPDGTELKVKITPGLMHPSQKRLSNKDNECVCGCTERGLRQTWRKMVNVGFLDCEKIKLPLEKLNHLAVSNVKISKPYLAFCLLV